MAPCVTYQALEETTIFYMVYFPCYLKVIREKWCEDCGFFCETALTTISLEFLANFPHFEKIE
jgi:hypothetical protein